MCWAGVCGPLDLVCLTDTLSTYPAFVSNWDYGFDLTSSPFWKDPKGTKRSSPHRTAFAALRFPRSGPAPWARRHGPSMAHRGSPGIHAGRPTTQNLLSASRRAGRSKTSAKTRSTTPQLFLVHSNIRIYDGYVAGRSLAELVSDYKMTGWSEWTMYPPGTLWNNGFTRTKNRESPSCPYPCAPPGELITH